MDSLGWTREIVTIPSLNKDEPRYFKDGFEVTEEQVIKIRSKLLFSHLLRNKYVTDVINGDLPIGAKIKIIKDVFPSDR